LKRGGTPNCHTQNKEAKTKRHRKQGNREKQQLCAPGVGERCKDNGQPEREQKGQSPPQTWKARGEIEKKFTGDGGEGGGGGKSASNPGKIWKSGGFVDNHNAGRIHPGIPSAGGE